MSSSTAAHSLLNMPVTSVCTCNVAGGGGIFFAETGFIATMGGYLAWHASCTRHVICY